MSGQSLAARQAQSPTPDSLVGIAELAAHLGISRRSVFEAINAGLPAVRIPGLRRLRFRLREVDAWLDAARAQSGSAQAIGASAPAGSRPGA